MGEVAVKVWGPLQGTPRTPRTIRMGGCSSLRSLVSLSSLFSRRSPEASFRPPH